ncbi:hypothetical protein [Undibacterium sp. CCC3.4]|uniref:hypothetical protein n=1 Tax=Undibacterium sp. CCC3.4 TaxID=3048609 RepID=UPI002B234125|nr:hypothetical protein [Undibacterium sp. CCC3.4]
MFTLNEPISEFVRNVDIVTIVHHLNRQCRKLETPEQGIKKPTRFGVGSEAAVAITNKAQISALRPGSANFSAQLRKLSWCQNCPCIGIAFWVGKLVRWVFGWRKINAQNSRTISRQRI